MKAQIQMMETIAVLFVFFILVVLGIIFYTQIAKSNIEQKTEEFSELSAIQVAQLATSLPELQCSEQNIIKENCIDSLRAAAAFQVFTRQEYFAIFGYSDITLVEVYPGSGQIPLYSRPLPSAKSKQKSFYPISVYDPASTLTHFGYLELSVYS